MLRNVTCIDISERADEKARSLLPKEGIPRMGFRLCKNKNLIVFEPLIELKTKDYVLQPRKVVIFMDPKSYEELYGTDIDYDESKNNWVFSQSERKLIKKTPPVKLKVNVKSKTKKI